MPESGFVNSIIDNFESRTSDVMKKGSNQDPFFPPGCFAEVKCVFKKLSVDLRVCATDLACFYVHVQFSVQSFRKLKYLLLLSLVDFAEFIA